MGAREFVDAAREFKGARWRHRGRKPWAVDCIGLVVLSGRKSGLAIHDGDRYGRDPWEDRLRKECQSVWGDPIPIEQRRMGDVALIRWKQGEPSHVAVIGDHPGGGLTLIHAHNLHGVIENGLSGPYLDCIVEVYRPRWPEVPGVN